ncbi:hypothetical protein DIPPA_08129 [Diplonema papillatum]|nr:hypothetical protein DIPPA_08129 [Diplonema papillatum]
MNSFGYQPPYPQAQARGYNQASPVVVIETPEMRKQKLKEIRQKKKLRRDEEYIVSRGTDGHGPLYTKISQRAGGVKYDCAACRLFVAAYAFYSHVVSQEHKKNVEGSRFSEDKAFISAEREFCLEAERAATGAVYCEPCKRHINPSCWEAHITGKPHRHATGQPPPAALELKNSTINTNPAKHPSTAFRVGANPISGPLLDSFGDQDNIPYFCVGEEMWKLDWKSNDASVAVVEEYKAELCLADQKRWGAKNCPAMLPALVHDAERCALGVCYKVPRSSVNQLCDLKKPDNVKLVEVTVREGAESVRAVAFCIRTRTPMDVASTAKYVASAIGTQGPNFGLLTRVVHELEKQDWKDPYFTDLMIACNNLIWRAKVPLK